MRTTDLSEDAQHVLLALREQIGEADRLQHITHRMLETAIGLRSPRLDNALNELEEEAFIGYDFDVEDDLSVFKAGTETYEIWLADDIDWGVHDKDQGKGDG